MECLGFTASPQHYDVFSSFRRGDCECHIPQVGTPLRRKMLAKGVQSRFRVSLCAAVCCMAFAACVFVGTADVITLQCRLLGLRILLPGAAIATLLLRCGRGHEGGLAGDPPKHSQRALCAYRGLFSFQRHKSNSYSLIQCRSVRGPVRPSVRPSVRRTSKTSVEDQQT